MNSHPAWPLGHGAPFLLPHHPNMGQAPLDSNTIHRFITPVSAAGMNHVDTQRDNQAQQHMRQDERVPTPQILDGTGFPLLRQMAVDGLGSWTNTEHHQQAHQQPPQPPNTAPNFGSSEDVASTVALQTIEINLGSELGGACSKVEAQKRKRNAKPMPETWKKNVRKTKRAKGEAYQSATGKPMPAKQIRDVDCSKCRLRCNETISFEQRLSIFESYWGTGSYVRQRDFLCSHVIEEEKARTTVKGEPSRKREWTRQYWLPKKSGKLVRVCKSFFLATLDVGCKTVDYALKKRKGGFFVDDDQRGKHEPTNKVTEDKLDSIRHHIESFLHLNMSPKKNKRNARVILPAEYNIRKMYQMYKDSCWESGETAQKEHVYRRLFNMEYTIMFHEPKKEAMIRNPGDHTLTKFDNTGPSHPGMKSMDLGRVELVNQSHPNPSNKTMDHSRLELTNTDLNLAQEVLKERHREKERLKQQQPPMTGGMHLQPPPPPPISAAGHVMPQHSSAPFVLQSNSLNSVRPSLDGTAVNMSMSQFHMPPSFIHPHHPTN